MPRSIAAEIRVRPARMDDYEFVQALYLETTGPLLARLGQKDVGEIIDRFKLLYRRSQSRIILRDGEDIGWIQVSENSVGLHLHQIFIIGRMRNHGIGTALIAGLQERARKKARPLSLNMIRGNPAVSLYQRLGFNVVGEHDFRLQMRWTGHTSARTGGNAI